MIQGGDQQTSHEEELFMTFVLHKKATLQARADLFLDGSGKLADLIPQCAGPVQSSQ